MTYDTPEQALEAAIAKWRELLTVTEPPNQSAMSMDTCALCHYYGAVEHWNETRSDPDEDADEDFCVKAGCPVALKSDESWCRATPFTEAYNARHAWMLRINYPDMGLDPALGKAEYLRTVEAEALFLEGLRNDPA